MLQLCKTDMASILSSFPISKNKRIRTAFCLLPFPFFSTLFTEGGKELGMCVSIYWSWRQISHTRAPVIRRPRPILRVVSCGDWRAPHPQTPEPWSWTLRGISRRLPSIIPIISRSMTLKTHLVAASFLINFAVGEKLLDPPAPPSQEKVPGKRWIFDVNCEDSVNPGVMGR